MAGIQVTVVIINQSSLVSHDELAAMLPALQRQVSEHFAPLWGVDAVVELAGPGQPVPAAPQPLFVMDSSDVAGDLGYHLAAPMIEAKVFVADCRRWGVPLSAVISHEIVEMLADPEASRTVQGRDGLWYIVECADPVAGDLYEMDGIPVSNFVTPRYFGLVADPGMPLDWLRRLGNACPELTPGGYIERWDGRQWSQLRARRADGSHNPLSDRPWGRTAWRTARRWPVSSVGDPK